MKSVNFFYHISFDFEVSLRPKTIHDTAASAITNTFRKIIHSEL